MGNAFSGNVLSIALVRALRSLRSDCQGLGCRWTEAPEEEANWFRGDRDRRPFDTVSKLDPTSLQWELPLTIFHPAAFVVDVISAQV